MIKIKNILVPCDFSEQFRNTLNYANFLADSMDSKLHIIHVIEPILFSFEIVVTENKLDLLPIEMEKIAKKNLEKIASVLTESDTKFVTDVLHGNAYEEILNYAEKNKIDLICIATHGHSNLENLLFGSTTEKVLRKAVCPVLIVRT